MFDNNLRFVFSTLFFILKVSPQNDNPSTTQFKKFRRLLESNVKKAENIRVVQHLRLVNFVIQTLQLFMIL